jgi:hypothetical protein
VDPHSPEPVFQTSFAYSPIGYGAGAVMLAVYVWALFHFYDQDGWSAWVILLTLLLSGAIWEWSMQPTSFIVEGETLTARWYWGRLRSWKIQELMIPGASKRWALAVSGYITVYERNGGKAFNVGMQLEDFSEFVELIEPGSRKKREPKHDPNSWWNRDVLK